jgi:cation:H+ antiporter
VLAGEPGRLVGALSACPRKERRLVPVALQLLVFFLAAAVSLATSYLLVTRLERIGERLGLSEALLGMLAALAADAPEITSAVTALAQHQQKVGAGVIIGSNVFNLAALLGLGGVVAGSIALHRRVVLLGGVIALWVAVVCLVTTTGTIPPAAGLVAVLAILVPYLVLLGVGAARLHRVPVARRWESWLAVAISEEEQELEEIIHPAHGRRPDVWLAVVALVVVVAASVVMERAGTSIGTHFGVPQIVTGGVVLAAVTSLPNAVAAVYLAARGRGAAMLSTTLNSNALNVAAGLLLPAAIIGLGPPSSHAVLIAVWYLGLTAAALAFAFRDGGVRRATGAFIIGSYLVFLGSLLATAHSAAPGPGLTVVPLLVTGLAGAAGLARRPGRRRGRGQVTWRSGQAARGGPPGDGPPGDGPPGDGPPGGAQLRDGQTGDGQPGEDPPSGASTTSDDSRS